MTISDLITRAHATAKEKGFWDTNRDVGELLMLVVSECGEALEAHRKGKIADLEGYQVNFDRMNEAGIESAHSHSFNLFVKDSFPDELADIVIRMADLCGGLKLPVPEDAPLLSKDEYGTNIGSSLFGICRALQFFAEALVKRATTDQWDPAEAVVIFHLVSALANAHDVDLERHVELKLAYNVTRERLHGKAY